MLNARRKGRPGQPITERIFSERFLATLPAHQGAAAASVVRRFVTTAQLHGNNFINQLDIEDAIDGHNLLSELRGWFGGEVQINEIDPKLVVENPQQFKTSVILEFQQAFSHLQTLTTGSLIEMSRSRIQAAIGKGTVFLLPPVDLRRIQQLVNELRSLVQECEDLQSDHKQRVLARMEELQRELHEKNSTLDKLFGVVIEAGAVLGRFGEKSKPFFDRLREILSIASQSNNRALGLPSSGRPPELPSGDSNS